MRPSRRREGDEVDEAPNSQSSGPLARTRSPRPLTAALAKALARQRRATWTGWPKMAKTKGRLSSRGSHETPTSKKTGGYAVSFKGDHTTFEDLFGGQPLTPNQMARELWAYIQKNGRGAVGVIDLDQWAADEEFREGTPSERRHITRERSGRLVAAVKRREFAQSGRLACKVCGFDFARMYGPRGDGFIEVHHTRPLSQLTRSTRMRLRDMALLCSNCHRMIHCRHPWLSTAQLRRLVQRNDHLSDRGHR